MEHFRGFSTNIGKHTLDLIIGLTVALRQIPQRRRRFTIRTCGRLLDIKNTPAE